MMHSPLRNGRFLVLLLLGLTLTACSNKLWTAAEKDELRHFTRSLHANSEANAILDPFTGGEPECRIGSIPESQVVELKSFYRTALSHAESVSDGVLDKLHPDLRGHYRSEFQGGISLFLAGLEYDSHVESRDDAVARQLKGQVLLDKWLGWILPRRDDLNKKLDDALH